MRCLIKPVKRAGRQQMLDLRYLVRRHSAWASRVSSLAGFCTWSVRLSVAIGLLTQAAAGQQLTFSSDRNAGQLQIWRTTITLPSSIQQVTMTGAGAQKSRYPAWSSSAGKIAFQFGASTVQRINLISPIGGSAVSGKLYLKPVWSPEGRTKSRLPVRAPFQPQRFS
jgi:hypothetical protein